MTEMEQARIEAEAAVAVAEDKLARLSRLRWAEAQVQAESNDFLAVLAELEKLPAEPWSTGYFYHPDGDYLEVYWTKPTGSTVVKWINHFVSVRLPVAEDGTVGEVPVGCQLSGAKGALERAGVFLTPDPPNPSRAVQEAKAAGVCRVCRVPLEEGAAPDKTVERFGNRLAPNALVFNFGEEYAHQACLNQEKAEDEEAA